MSFFQSLQNSAFTDWLLGSESIWAYPTVLTLHTVGLAVLVGASTMLQLRLLGVGASVPLDRLRMLYSLIWPAFVVNLASGVALFITQAADRVLQPLFYLKLASIAVALWLGQEAKRSIFDRPPSTADVSAGMRQKAAVVLGLWTAAIVSGRLMAYFSGR
jgi:hypothetical protein